MAVVPGRFDHDPAEMGIPRFGDPAAARLAPLECSTGRAPRRPSRCGGRKAARIAQLGGDGQAVRLSMPRKQRRRRARVAIGSSVRQACRSVSTAASRARASSTARRYAAWVCCSARQRPPLRAQPRVVRAGPCLFGAGEATAVPQEKLRQPMPRPKQIGANVLAAAQEVPHRFFLVGGNMDARERTRAIQHGQLDGIATIGLLIRSPARRGISAGAITLHTTHHRPSVRAGARSRRRPREHRHAPLRRRTFARKRRIVGTSAPAGARPARRLPGTDRGRHRCGVLIEGHAPA